MNAPEIVLNQQMHGAAPAVRKAPFAGPIAWERDSLAKDDGLIRLDADSRRELDGIVEVIRHNPLPTAMLSPDEFEIPACRAMMARAKEVLEDGVGFVIIDRLPLDAYSVDEARAVYWILLQLVSRPVAQSWDGKVIYDSTVICEYLDSLHSGAKLIPADAARWDALRLQALCNNS